LLSIKVFCFGGFLFFVFHTTAAAQKTKKPKKKAVSDSVKKTPQNTKFTPLEAAVADEINQARNDPQKVIQYLEEYRKYMKGTILSMPNKIRVQMNEGVSAIDDAISDLKKLAKIDSFEISNGLSKVARQQLTDLQENPKLKHFGKDGSDLEKRLLKVGFAGNPIAENISYQADTAREFVLNMIIDDGYKSRSHRKNIFSKNFKLFGVACGVAIDKTTICVTEFASSFKER